MSLLLAFSIFFASVSCILAINGTEQESRISPLHIQLSRRPYASVVKGFPGLESVLGVMGPLALAAMVSLPFVAPAAAALLPLASLSSVFGRRRRYLDDSRDSTFSDADALMRRIHAAAIRRNLH